MRWPFRSTLPKAIVLANRDGGTLLMPIDIASAEPFRDNKPILIGPTAVALECDYI